LAFKFTRQKKQLFQKQFLTFFVTFKISFLKI
jgi:hypothetical protein